MFPRAPNVCSNAIKFPLAHVYCTYVRREKTPGGENENIQGFRHVGRIFSIRYSTTVVSRLHSSTSTPLPHRVGLVLLEELEQQLVLFGHVDVHVLDLAPRQLLPRLREQDRQKKDVS